MADTLIEIDRNKLTDHLMRWLSPNDHGYFITLNSLSVLDGQADRRFEHEMFKLRPKVNQVMGF